jgi:hypothetical protein
LYRTLKAYLNSAENLAQYEQQIRKIGNRVNDPNLFQRIQEACHKKQAFLFSSQSSFFVLTFKANRVLVWVLHAFERVDLVECFTEIRTLAHEVNAQGMEFWTNRKGFSKTAIPIGFNHYETKWCDKPITVWYLDF